MKTNEIVWEYQTSADVRHHRGAEVFFIVALGKGLRVLASDEAFVETCKREMLEAGEPDTSEVSRTFLEFRLRAWSTADDDRDFGEAVEEGLRLILERFREADDPSSNEMGQLD